MHTNTFVHQRFDQISAQGRRDIFVNQETFRSTTNPSTAGFRIENNAKRLFGIGSFVDVDVHDAFEVGKDRHAGLALDQTNKALATTRDDHVDIVDSSQHCSHGLTVAGRD